MVDKVKVALGQVFRHTLLFFTVDIVPPMLLIHIHSFINHQCHVIAEIDSIIKQHTKKDNMGFHMNWDFDVTCVCAVTFVSSGVHFLALMKYSQK